MQPSIRKQLMSDDPDTVLDGLFALGGLRDGAPASETLRLAVRHFASNDPDVRRQAVVAAVIHWGYVPAIVELAKLARNERDVDVLVAVLPGLSRLAQENPSLVCDVLSILQHFCFMQERTPGLRRRAFLEAKALMGEVSAGQYAASPADDGPEEPSNEWFDRRSACS